eukprot:scaffold64721_cov20-Tisochrysis_lutea.AAC.4
MVISTHRHWAPTERMKATHACAGDPGGLGQRRVCSGSARGAGELPGGVPALPGSGRAKQPGYECQTRVSARQCGNGTA